MNLSSEGWEKYYNQTTSGAWKADAEEYLLKKIQNTHGNYALDVASGDGRNTHVLVNHFLTVCAVDLSKTAIQNLKSSFIERSMIPPLLISEDFMKISFEENQFEFIICFDGLPQMNNTETVIHKMYSYLSPGGKLLFNFFTKNDCAFGEGEKIDNNTYSYKETIFKFYEPSEIEKLFPEDAVIEDVLLKSWNDPPHGDFRPYPHTHKAVFYTLAKPI